MKLILILLSIEQEEKQSHVARAHPVQFAFFSLHLILLFFFLLSSSCWRFAFVRWLAVAMAHLFCLECCCYLSCCCQWMTQKNIIKFLIQLFFCSTADEITLNFHYLIIVALAPLREKSVMMPKRTNSWRENSLSYQRWKCISFPDILFSAEASSVSSLYALN